MNIAGDLLIAFAAYGALALFDRLFALGGGASEPIVLVGLVIAVVSASFVLRMVRR